MRLYQRSWVGLACSAGLVGLLATIVPAMSRGRDARDDLETEARADADPAVERTREQVRMLDD